MGGAIPWTGDCKRVKKARRVLAEGIHSLPSVEGIHSLSSAVDVMPPTVSSSCHLTSQQWWAEPAINLSSLECLSPGTVVTEGRKETKMAWFIVAELLCIYLADTNTFYDTRQLDIYFILKHMYYELSCGGDVGHDWQAFFL